MATFANRIGNPDVFLGGAYAQLGYFLTGEHRPYDRALGQIDRVKPFTNFFRVRSDHGVASGWGAWELATRLSYIDLNDKDVHGGELVDVTAGINWYWNPYTKVVFNYIHAFNNNPTYGWNDTDIFAMRAQMDF
jgi:phosphate-selective porin OprO/OprP